MSQVVGSPISSAEPDNNLRAELIQSVKHYLSLYPSDHQQTEPFIDFFNRDLNWFDRSTQFGHLTASGWVVGPDGESVVLIHHRKLARWLQPGGHADGDSNLLRVAAREVEEETGLKDLEGYDAIKGKFVPLRTEAIELLPFDLDAHLIPATTDFPAHIHFDYRFLFRSRTTVLGSGDSGVLAVRWFSTQDVDSKIEEIGIRRMADKAKVIL